jgi:hypothetical protein
VLAGQADRLRAVGGLGDHGHVGLGVEQRPEAGPYQGLIVGQQHFDHGFSSGRAGTLIMGSPQEGVAAAS